MQTNEVDANILGVDNVIDKKEFIHENSKKVYR